MERPARAPLGDFCRTGRVFQRRSWPKADRMDCCAFASSQRGFPGVVVQLEPQGRDWHSPGGQHQRPPPVTHRRELEGQGRAIGLRIADAAQNPRILDKGDPPDANEPNALAFHVNLTSKIVRGVLGQAGRCTSRRQRHIARRSCANAARRIARALSLLSRGRHQVHPTGRGNFHCPNDVLIRTLLRASEAGPGDVRQKTSRKFQGRTSSSMGRQRWHALAGHPYPRSRQTGQHLLLR